MPVFAADYAQQYDRLYAAKNYQQECDLIEGAITRHGSARPATIIDIGCGTGGHALELAQRGYRLTGVDLSESMLKQAQSKAASLESERRPVWVHGDARDFKAGGPFDMAIMMFAVVGYLTRNEDVLQGLANIRSHLKPGGLFVCDFWYGPSVLSDRPTDRARVLPTPRGEVIRTTNTVLDVVRHTADVTFQLWTLEDGKVASATREKHSLRYFFPQEFALLLGQSGFEMLNISAFPTLDGPLTDESWNALVVARAK
jgi:SAM-dependent methyltransferase